MEESAIESLDAYLVSANSELLEGGKLYCESESGGERHPYNSCESFSALREQGCFGYTTFEISWEIRNEATCAKIKALTLATSTPRHYFNLELANWWEPLPAELIPMSGGLRSDAGWAIEKQKRDELVGGKELRELPLMEITSEPGHFEATLELIKGECGETRHERPDGTIVVAHVIVELASSREHARAPVRTYGARCECVERARDRRAIGIEPTAPQPECRPDCVLVLRPPVLQ